jgi:predicted DNA-binding ribbon-helix-helix protein
MKSVSVKRSVVINGHKTSVSLEDEFWNGLKEFARRQHASLSNTINEIDKKRRRGNLSSAIRLFVLNWERAQPQQTRNCDPMSQIMTNY